MRFWDSSAMAALLLHQPTHAWAEERLTEDSDLVVWWVTPVECVSAISRLERAGAIPVSAVDEALARLETTSRRWAEVHPTAAIRDLARRFVRVHPLRAADALQLAAALVASESNPPSLAFVCLDARLGDVAGREGFPVVPRPQGLG